MHFGESPHSFKSINMNGNQIETFTWHDHVYITAKASPRLYFLCMLKRAGVSSTDIHQVYISIIRPLLEYACEVWHPGLTGQLSQQIEHIQKRAFRIIYTLKTVTRSL